MHGPIGVTMLAARREFQVLEERFRTPLIVPSYSSRAVEEDVKEVIGVTRAFVRGPILISAYDIVNHKLKQNKLSHANLIFLDSGGYEAGSQSDLTEIEDPRSERTKWTIEKYNNVVSNWNFQSPTVLVSYDEPYKRVRLTRQISRAKRNQRISPQACHAILLKPEPQSLRKGERAFIKFDRLLEEFADLLDFDIIGVTEKELGNSTFERMKMVASIRKSLENHDRDIPIHVFGSLDPVSTPLYFLAGADIFDGLTWLRFAYCNGLAVYRQNILARDERIALGTRDGELAASVQLYNYLALGRLQESMRQFLQTRDFDVFGANANLLKNATEQLAEEVGVRAR